MPRCGWLGICGGTGCAIGALCVMDRKPRRLMAQQIEALRILGHQVMTQLELRHNLIELEVSVASHLRAAWSLRVLVGPSGCDRIEVERHGQPPLIEDGAP